MSRSFRLQATETVKVVGMRTYWVAENEMNFDAFEREVFEDVRWQTIEIGKVSDESSCWYFRGIRKTGVSVYLEGSTWQDIYNQLPDWCKRGKA